MSIFDKLFGSNVIKGGAGGTTPGAGGKGGEAYGPGSTRGADGKDGKARGKGAVGGRGGKGGRGGRGGDGGDATVIGKGRAVGGAGGDVVPFHWDGTKEDLEAFTRALLNNAEARAAYARWKAQQP